MRKTNLIFTALLVPLDYLALMLAAITAYSIRFTPWVREVRPIVFDLPFGPYMDIVFPLALLWIIIFAASGLYSMKESKKMIAQFGRIFAACSTGLILIVFLVFFSRELFSSRFIVLAAWILSILFIFLNRLIIKAIKLILWKKGIGVRNLIIVGDDKTTYLFLDYLKKYSKHGYRVLGHFKKIDKSNQKQFDTLIFQKNIDEILLADYSLAHEQSLLLLQIANEFHVSFRYAPDLFETQAGKVEIGTLLGVPLVEIKKTPLEGWGRIWKRIYDIFTSIIAIILFSPVMLIIAGLIKLDSKGSVIYKNERVGEKGNLFNTYKFRTMKIEYCTGTGYDKTGKAEKFEEELIKEKSIRKGPIYKIGEDPRRTYVGYILEKTSLDELPQFFNVFLGNMSIVGPRPHQEREVNQYKKQYPSLFEIKPGITGLAQISGRSDLDFKEEIKLDLYYVENWALWRDIVISVKTPFIALFGRHRS